jgi:hypothetical protein
LVGGLSVVFTKFHDLRLGSVAAFRLVGGDAEGSHQILSPGLSDAFG